MPPRKIDIDIDSLFHLDNIHSYGNGAFHSLDKRQSLHDVPASLQVRQENKITSKNVYTIAHQNINGAQSPLDALKSLALIFQSRSL